MKKGHNDMDLKTTKDGIDEDDALRILSSEVGVKYLVGDNTTSKLPPLDVIFDRTLDTVEDALVHAGRIPYDLGWVSEETPEKDDRPVVVVLGSGWGAHAFMKIADTFKVRVIVVSPSNHFVFTPMLASAAVGTVEYRSMTESVRAANPMIDSYIEGTAIDVDPNKKTVTVKLVSFLEDIRRRRSTHNHFILRYIACDRRNSSGGQSCTWSQGILLTTQELRRCSQTTDRSGRIV